MYKILLPLIVIGLVSHPAEAGLTEIVPDSYYFDKDTDVGRFEYHDWTGNQLIDGVYGGEVYSLNLGSGNAYEWVGWRGDEVVNIDFFFHEGETELINEVRIGVSQSRTNDVVFPDLHILSSKDGENWVSIDSIKNPENSAYDGTKGIFSFYDLGFSQGEHIRITASWNNDGPWTFIDEIDFYSVPTPSIAFIIPLVGVGLVRKKRKKEGLI